MNKDSQPKSLFEIQCEIQSRMDDVSKYIRDWDYVDDQLEKLKKEYWKVKMREEFCSEDSTKVIRLS